MLLVGILVYSISSIRSMEREHMESACGAAEVDLLVGIERSNARSRTKKMLARVGVFVRAASNSMERHENEGG